VRPHFKQSGIPYEKGWIKGTNSYSWFIRPHIPPVKKAKAIADSPENQFTTHDLNYKNHEPLVKGRGQGKLEAVNDSPPEKMCPCDVQKLINSLKHRTFCAIYDIQNECLGQIPSRVLVNLTHLFNHCFRVSRFPSSQKEAKLGKEPKFPTTFDR
jgi:hypothetical protein